MIAGSQKKPPLGLSAANDKVEHTACDHALLYERAEARFDSLLTENGASHPTKLPVAVAGELFRPAVVETAAAEFQGADPDGLSRGIKSLTHSAFFPALECVRHSIAEAAEDSDIFWSAIGVDAAVVLAGFGLAVAPYDLKIMRILKTPSNDIDTVLALFHRRKTAVVGYNVCEAPFYVLLTDCVQALRRQLPISPELSEVRKLYERTGAPQPPDPGKCFESDMVLFAHEPGDRIPTVGLMDPNPLIADIVLLAGWEANGASHGAPSGGHRPVPWNLLEAVVFDPEAASFLCSLVGAPPTLH